MNWEILLSQKVVALPRIVVAYQSYISNLSAGLFGFPLEYLEVSLPARNLRRHTLSPSCWEQNSANPAIRA